MNSKLSRHFTIITLMFLSLILGMLLYTIITIKKEQSNALIIDMAGRQRMLFQKHMNEVLFASQGVTTNYPSTRRLILSTLRSLTEGGPVIVNPVLKSKKIVPVVPTNEILTKLREQQNHFKTIIKLTDNFLMLSTEHPEYPQMFKAIQEQHAMLIGIADSAVKLLNAHSESNIEDMVKWESLVAALVALMGILVTGQGIRDGRKLENEISERKRAESEVRNSQLFLDSIVENIPHMIYVKRNEDLQYVLLNKTAEELLDCPRQDLIGKTVYDILSEEEAGVITANDRKVLASKTIMDLPDESIHIQSKGLRYLHTKLVPLFNDIGQAQFLLGITQDITERLQAEDALRRSEERYKALYEDNPSMYFTVSQDGSILSVNEFGSHQLGYSVKELVGHPVMDLFLEDDRAQVQQRFEACLQSPLTVFSWEFRKVRKNGSVFWVKEAARAVHNQDGKIVVLIVCEDISERKTTEKALQEWKALTESILGQLPKGFAYRCLNTKTWPIVYASEGIEEVTGYPTSDLLNGNITYDTLMAPGENERVWPLVQGALAQHLPYENEHQIITRDGKTKWILARGRFIFDDTGTLLYLDGLNVDITDYKQIEKDLRSSEARFRSLIEHVPFCIHEIELDGKISSMNQAGQDMIGIENESQAIGDSYLNLAEQCDHDRIREYFTQAVQGKAVHFEFKITQHAEVRVFTKSFIPIRGSDRKVLKIVGISEDITERRLAEERLRESEAKRISALKQSDTLKSALLSSVSHELRTPLTTMKASVSSIIGSVPRSMNATQLEFLSGVDKEINYMSRLVDNLLDMSQIEAGTLTPHREWHPLEDLLEGAIRRAELTTAEPQNIEVRISEDVPPIFVDAIEMQQVLINLLDNAVKYSSPRSPIYVHVRTGSQKIEVEVSNTGEHLHAEDLERIFDRFYRRQSPRDQPIRGTGLGLAICKGIVEAHGGRIWAESVGEKVTITFTIPVTESMASFSLEGLQKS